MKLTLSGLAATLLMAVAAPVFAQAPAAGAPVAKVNGVTIPASLGNMLIKEQVGNGAPDSPELKTQVRDHLVRREVLLQTARKGGLDKQAEIRQRMEYVRDEMLINAYLEDWARKNPITDAAAKAEYDRAARQAGDTEYKSRHILLEKEDEAKAIIAKLQTGARFADLVKESKDPGSAENGGDLGWSRPSAFVKEFGEALARLEKGKFTPQPVRTEYGYHVMLLDDVRKAEPPKFEDIKERIVQSLQQQAVQTHVTGLMGKAKIE